MTTDIDKAAQEAWDKYDIIEPIGLDSFPHFIKGFRAGAEWREGQQHCPYIRTSKEGTSWCALAEQGRVLAAALQKIVDATPANAPSEWPHHHFYLITAKDALDAAPEPEQDGEDK